MAIHPARDYSALALIAVLLIAMCPSSVADDEKSAEPEQSAADNDAHSASPDSGARTLTVRVLDEWGQPLADANVHVSIWEVEGGKDYPNRDFTTNEQGTAEIEIPRRLHIMRLWPSKEGYVPLFVNFARGAHEEGRLIPDEYEFRLPEGYPLSGRVVDAEGNPIAGARVEVEVESPEPSWGANPRPIFSSWLSDEKTITDGNGRWSIDNAPPPPASGKRDHEIQLQVTHPDYVGDTSWGELQRAQGITTADLRSGNAVLSLERGMTISGTITGPDGAPVTEGLVVWDDRPGDYVCRIDEQGHYKTGQLAPGEHPLAVFAPGFAPTRTVVALNQEAAELNFELQPGNPLRIEIVDQTGQPIPDVTVYIDRWRDSYALANNAPSSAPDNQVPGRADIEGVFQWDWAPDDGVIYRISAKGYAPQELTLVAKPTPHKITLFPQRIVEGTLTDATTGEPIPHFEAMPVIIFRPDFYSTRTTDAKVGTDGHYELPLTGSADPGVRYFVRFEADGYRSLISEQSFGPTDGRATLDVSLEPTPLRTGRVVDADGNPVADATILQASPSEVPRTRNAAPESYGTRPIRSDADGNFEFRATSEPVLVRAYHDLGFAEMDIAADEDSIGELKLAPWATISGQLVQAGRPVANQGVQFWPFSSRGLTDARFQDSFGAETDIHGNFHFERIPPVGGNLRAYLGPWEDSPLTSSHSVPLKMTPGEHREVVLGGGGPTIVGRVVATGRDNGQLSKQWSLNYLVSRDHGVDDPQVTATLGFEPAGPLQTAWLREPDFNTWRNTRSNYFVKLADDGQFAIHGVEPGEYDLVIQLYEEPAGCLVETIGERIVPITVTADAATQGQVDIGDIDIECRSGPRVGSNMRAFKLTGADGRVRMVDDMQGQYVLLHAWATWCAPCVESMPKLRAAVQQHSESPLVVVGLNLDDDKAAAETMAEDKELAWSQNYLGSESDLARQLAISSVPAYYLIGPDGKLVGSTNQWEVMEQMLSAELELSE